MVTYIDRCVFCRAQEAGRLDAFLDAVVADDAAFAKEVELELCGRPGKDPKPEQKAAAEALRARGLKGKPILLNDPAATTYQALRAGRKGTSDAGECASIAIAMHEQGASFSTAEVRAGWLAASELDGRVRPMPNYLRDLVLNEHLARADARAIMQTASHTAKVRVPTWWPGFL